MPDATTTITFFSDYAATSKTETVLDLDDLVRKIETTTAASRAELPWLKLAKFGDIRTDKHSLRHNANLLAVTGIEADYDGEVMSFDEAHERLGAAGLRAILYTSPSYRPEAPRWRVLAPLSADYPPGERDRFLARLNGLFEGIFAGESWTLSQSYYYGSVNGNPSHQVVLLDGRCIDQADELDTSAIGKPVKASKPNGAHHDGPATSPGQISDRRINALFQSLLANISAAPDKQKHHRMRANAKSIGGRLHLSNWSVSDAVNACMVALEKCDSEVKDWAHARKNAEDAIEAGRLKPMPLEDSPEYLAKMRERGNGIYDPAPPVGEPLPPPTETETKTDGQEQQFYRTEEEPDDEEDGPGAEWLAEPGERDAEIPPPDKDAGAEATEADADAAIDAVPVDDVLNAIAELGPGLTRKMITALFNKRYAVAYEGSKTGVMWSAFDPLLKRDHHRTRQLRRLQEALQQPQADSVRHRTRTASRKRSHQVIRRVVAR